MQKAPIEDKYKGFSLRRVTSTAIPFLLFRPADRLVQSLLHPRTGLSVGEKRGFSSVLHSPEMGMFHKLVLTMPVRNWLNYLVILSGKFVPRLHRLPRYSQS